ncbi:MAG TPA: GspH/FimT family pseudopilin [Rubrivivax sp.]|nr:GspH/FimT family pseudopilin [Rubrivivax sp.]
MKHAKPRLPARGLTLIELVITLAVLAILSAVALPSIGASLDRHRLQASAHALAADIGEARFEAARRGQALHLQASAGADWCWSVSVNPDCPCGQAQTCQLQNVRAVDHPGVQIVSAQALRLDGAGVAQAGTAALLQSRRGDRLRVDVSALGRTRICSVSGSWPTLPPC